MISFYQRFVNSSLVHVAVFYATIGLFFLELLFGVMGRGEVRLGGFPPQDLALALVVGYMCAISPQFWGALCSKTSLAYVFALGFYTVVGYILGNSIGWIRTDLRFFLWIYGGFAVLSLWWRLPWPEIHLHVIMGFMVVMLYFGVQQSHATHFENNNFRSGEDRLYGLNLFAVGSAMLYFMAIHYTVFSTQSRLSQISAAVVSAIFCYVVLYLSATRNLLLSFVAMAAACLPTFLYQLEEGFFARRVMTLRLILLGVVGAVGIFFVGAHASDLLVIERFKGGNILQDASARGRITELERVLYDFDSYQYIMGAGLGETFQPSYNYAANFLHFGIAGLVLKLGLPVGIAVAVGLFVFLPIALLWAFIWPGSLTPSMRTAIYASVPITFPWLVQLGISGGFTPLHALGAGMAIGVFYHTRHTGLHIAPAEAASPRFRLSSAYRTA